MSAKSWIVLLVRLTPLVPFNVLNYALGLSSVNLIPYIAYSWLGMIPGTLLYVYIGWAAVGAVTSNASGTESILKDVLVYGVG